MKMTSILEWFGTLTSIISKGHWVIFVLMVVESTSIPSIIPAEVVLVTAGYYVGKGDLNFMLAIFSATAGSLVGAYINYFIAFFIGRKFVYKYGKYVLLNIEKIKKLEILFSRYANILTLVGRLMPLIKHVISLPAGFCSMNKKAFTLFTTIGSAILSTLMITLGMFIGKSTKTVDELKIYIYSGLFALSGIFIIAYIVYNKYSDSFVGIVRKKTESNNHS